jgi:hypothetical protein
VNQTREPDVVLVLARWGALWACVLGIWIVAPPLLQVHRLRPARPVAWLEVEIGLFALFALVGMVLGVMGGFAIAAIETLARRRFRRRLWVYRLAVAPMVAVGYVGDALLVHRNTFGSLDGAWSMYGRDAILAAVGVVVGSMLLAWFYLRVVIARELRPATLARPLCAAALIGAVALVPQAPPRLPAVPVTIDAHPSANAPPLLFLGLDGATWRVLEPAIASGQAPTFRRIVETGMHGTIEAQWPPYWSSAGWASILTGLPRDVTGVYEDLAGTAPGLPWFQIPQSMSIVTSPMLVLRAAMVQSGAIRFTPPPRALLNGTPVWELMHNAGINSAVVRFRFTYPAVDQADIVISDWAGRDEWENLGVRRDMLADSVGPRSDATELLAPFRQETPWNPALFSSLLPGPVPPKPRDARSDPIDALRIASDIDERTFYSAESILRRHRAQPFLAIYIGGLDATEHAFWQYRFPSDFNTNLPSPADVERLGPVLDRYVHYVDERLGQLLAEYSVAPDVVIVSDHGHGPTTTASDWRGWHTKDGVFLAAGPGVAHRTANVAVSYYDVLPTLLDLEGLRHLQGLSGHSLRVSPDGPE